MLPPLFFICDVDMEGRTKIIRSLLPTQGVWKGSTYSPERHSHSLFLLTTLVRIEEEKKEKQEREVAKGRRACHVSDWGKARGRCDTLPFIIRPFPSWEMTNIGGRERGKRKMVHKRDHFLDYGEKGKVCPCISFLFTPHRSNPDKYVKKKEGRGAFPSRPKKTQSNCMVTRFLYKNRKREEARKPPHRLQNEGESSKRVNLPLTSSAKWEKKKKDDHRPKAFEDREEVGRLPPVPFLHPSETFTLTGKKEKREGKRTRLSSGEGMSRSYPSFFSSPSA